MVGRDGRMVRGLATMVPLALVVAVLATVAPQAPPAEAALNPNKVAAVTAGSQHTCALMVGGAVRCWGEGGFGMLGRADPSDIGDDEAPVSVAPIDLGPGRTATAIEAGSNHTCAILDDGSVRCWGAGADGRLGYANTADVGDDETPASVGPVDLGVGRTATAISAGGTHTCAVLDDGSVRCWGQGGNGQLGYAATATIGDDETPGTVGPVNLGAGRTATAVTTGRGHTCAILDDASVRCWGSGSFGRLGYANTTTIGDDETPGSVGPVDLGGGRTAASISAVGEHTCVVRDDATVVCWGDGFQGELGYGNVAHIGDDETPGSAGAVDLGAGRTALSVAAGSVSTCARLDDGTVRCWGSAGSGVVGYGNTTNIGDNETPGSVGPVDLGVGRTATGLAVGSHACAVLDTTAQVRCWGPNTSGQLGYGNGTAPIGDNETPGSAGPVDLGIDPTGVSGTVTDSVSAAPVPGAFVVALRSNDFTIAAGAVADPTGNYAIGLAPGSYFVYLIDPTGAHTAGFAGAPTLVNVTPATTTPLNGAMVPTRGSFTGTVVDDPSFTPIGGALVVSLSGTTGAPEVVTAANGAGAYTMSGMRPGNHYVGFIDPTGTHRTEFHPNAPNVQQSTPLAVTTGGSTLASVALSAQTPTGTGAALTGTVTGGNGNPLPGALVIALHAADYRLARATLASPTGTYSLDVTAGPYKLEFLDSSGLHDMEWHNNLPASGIASAASVTAPAVTNASLDPRTGTLTGSVTADPGGTPLEGVWVLAIGPSGIAGGAATSATGTYSIPGLTPGTYRVTFVDPSGRRAQEYHSNSPDYAGATPFNITAGATQTINAALALNP